MDYMDCAQKSFIVGIRSFRQVYCLINGKKWVGSFSDISSVPYQLLGKGVKNQSQI